MTSQFTRWELQCICHTVSGHSSMISVTKHVSPKSIWRSWVIREILLFILFGVFFPSSPFYAEKRVMISIHINKGVIPLSGFFPPSSFPCVHWNILQIRTYLGQVAHTKRAAAVRFTVACWADCAFYLQRAKRGGIKVPFAALLC